MSICSSVLFFCYTKKEHLGKSKMLFFLLCSYYLRFDFVIQLHIGKRYKKQANAIEEIGAPTDASGTAPAIDQGTSAAITTAVSSRVIANLLLSLSESLQS